MPRQYDDDGPMPTTNDIRQSLPVAPNRDTPKGLLKKLHAIMSEITYLTKDKINPHFKYNYLSEQAIKEAVQPQLIKHGVVFKLDVNKVEQQGTLTSIWVSYTFADIETSDQINGSFYGYGVDNQDKGLYKAITGAIKYIMTSTFLIPTGDDPETDSPDIQQKQPATLSGTPRARVELEKAVKAYSEAPSIKSAYITSGQAKRLWAIARSAGWEDVEVREFLIGRGYGSTEDIPWKDYDGICQVLEAGNG